MATPNRRVGLGNSSSASANKPNKLEAAGFTRAISPIKHRIITAVDGVEKSGKSHVMLTAPEPLAIIDLDIGLEGVIQQWQENKEIWVIDAGVTMRELRDMNPQEASKQAERGWDRVIKGYLAAVGETRAVGVDNATELWELLRMARFGKLDHVKPHHYGPVNAEYRDFIRLAYDQDRTSLILLHKTKDEYIDNDRTGRKIRAGFSDTGFLVQLNASCYRVPTEPFPDCFHMTINDCRQNAELAGVDLSGSDLSFPKLASMVFPDTTEEFWV